MSLFRREARSGSLEATLTALGLPTRGGRSVGLVSDRRQAARQSVVWACARLNADLVSTFPLHAFKKTAGGRAEIDTPGWLVEPSPGLGIGDWIDAMSMSLDYNGNAFALMTLGPDGWPTASLPLDPEMVHVRRADDGAPQYLLGREVLPTDRVMHISGPRFAGMLRGMNPIEFAALSIGTGLAGREYVSQFFTDGAHPSMEVIADRQLDEGEAAKIKADVLAVANGSREPWVHGSGLETKVWQLSPTASGFLETIQATDLDICRFMGLRQPELIGVTLPQNGSLNYMNNEQRGIALQQFSIGPRVVRFERALSRWTPRGQYVKLNMDSLRRPDAMTRAKIEDIRLRNGTWSQNDVRELEDESPIPGGDQYLWPPTARTGGSGGSSTEGGGDAAA